jgi:hypothetical protein
MRQAAQSRKAFELRGLLIQLREQVSGRHQLVRILVFLLYAVLLPIPLITRDYYLIRVGGSVGIYLMLAAGLSIVAGQAGLLDLGYVGFYAIGAYTYALLASPKFGIHLPFLVAASLGILAAVIAALAVSIPTLRLHGDYLSHGDPGFRPDRADPAEQHGPPHQYHQRSQRYCGYRSTPHLWLHLRLSRISICT